MTKRKIIIIAVAVLVAAALLVGAYYGISAYREYKEKSIEFEIKDTLADGGGKKATVILLGGQSNAAGCSRDDYLQQNVSAEKHGEYMNGYSNVYINYFVTGTNESQGFVKCAALQGELGGYFGPELGMAEKLHQMYPDELFFIIKYTWSGSDLFSQWLSPSSEGKTGQLYKEFVKYVETSIKYLISKNYDVEIEAMCWMQGESDSFSVENGTNYEVHLANFIEDVREKFSKYAAEDGIAFIDAYIADNPAYWVYCELVNRSKQAVADMSPMNVVIDTNAHGLDCSKEPAENPDRAHYDSMSELKLGYLFAEQVARFKE